MADDNISPNTLLSFLTRKPSAAAVTPEEEAKLLERQASILESLKATQPSSSTDLISQALAGALPLIGGALAGDNLGLAAGASAGAGAVEAYRKQMEKEQEEKKTTSLLELANVQKQLDASALARQEAAKAAAGLEKAKATTMLGQIEAAGGSPEDYLNYVRGQAQRATPTGEKIVPQDVLMQSIPFFANAGMQIEPGSKISYQDFETMRRMAADAQKNNESFKKADSAQREVTRNLIERANQSGFGKTEEIERAVENPNTTMGELERINKTLTDAMRGMTQAAGEERRGETEARKKQEIEAKKQVSGLTPAKDFFAQSNIESPKDIVVTEKKAEDMRTAKTAREGFKNKLTQLRALIQENGDRLPINTSGSYGTAFGQLTAGIVNDIRLLNKMGANFTQMEKDNTLLQAFGFVPGNESAVLNLGALQREFLGASPLSGLNRFERDIDNGYARSTIQNGYIDPSITYSDKVIAAFPTLNTKAQELLLLQNNPELQKAVARRRAAERARQGQ